MHFGGSLYRNAWEALVLNSTWYDAYDPWSIFFRFQAGLRYRPLIGEHVNFHIFHMIFCRNVSELGWNHHLIVPVVNCNMCESESLKIGIPWHHCDPLEGSHFQLVFGKSLSCVVWWLVLPQFQLHQPLTSCIGQLGCHLGGFFGGTGYPASTLRTSTQLMQGVFWGDMWETWRLNRAVSYHFIDSVSSFGYIPVQSKVYQLYQSIGVLDWLVPGTKVWAQLPKAFLLFIYDLESFG